MWMFIVFFLSLLVSLFVNILGIIFKGLVLWVVFSVVGILVMFVFGGFMFVREEVDE